MKKSKLKMTKKELWGVFSKRQEVVKESTPRTAADLTKLLKGNEGLGTVSIRTSRMLISGVRAHTIVRNDEGLELVLPIGSIIFKNTDPTDLKRDKDKLVLEFGGCKAEISIEMVRTVKNVTPDQSQRRPTTHGPKMAGTRRF